MERKLGRVPVMILTLLFSAAAYGLRQHLLETAYEVAADGALRVIPGTGSGFFTWFTAAAVILFAVYAMSLEKRPTYAALGQLLLPEAMVGCVAGLALVLGSAAMLLTPNTVMEPLLGAGGLVTAICWVSVVLLQLRGKMPSVYVYLIPAVFFAVLLVVDFRVWSRDPAVLDYCYDLFALISVMCGLFYLSGFSLEQGRRRTAVFFLLCGEFFCAASIAGAPLRQVCLLGGAMLWMGINLWKLLKKE